MKKTRRQFLGDAGCGLGAAALLSSLGSLSRLDAAVTANAASDYKALVCIFLFGGNDANNMIVPYDEYASYQSVRGTTLNIPKSSLLQIDAPSQHSAFGLHPSLPELHSLYQSGKLAVVANVGTLVSPVTRSQFLAGSVRPDGLFSHADQQNAWQSSIPYVNSLDARTGWGGRLADTTAALNSGTFPMVVSVSGVPLFTTGLTARPLVPGKGLSGFSSSAASTARYSSLLRILGATPPSTLVGAHETITREGISHIEALNAALSQIQPLNTAFPQTQLGGQVEEIANVIAARNALGVNRQIFFASLGGFDTHTGEIDTQATLLTEVSQAMAALYNATVELGVASQVTTFTLSDFGRTLQPTSGGGSDHAWGSHHFILGGSVRGADFYGSFPTLALEGPDDASDEGRWIPTTSVEQYGATLARWYGLSPSALPEVFPFIDRFATSDLGFLG
jgi:uncharacterized protein (DUF1501 family)